MLESSAVRVADAHGHAAAGCAGCPERPRRLLHVFSTFDVGGSQMRFVRLANSFGGRYEHAVIAMDGRYGCVERLEVPLTLPRPAIDKRAVLRNPLRFRRLLRNYAPDVLVTYNWGATEWGLANLWPLCRHIHVEDGFGPDEVQRQRLRRILFRRLALASVQRVVLPSQTLCRIARDVWKLPESRIAYVPNGIDCARFDGAGDPDLRRRLALDGGTLLVGTVAALRPEKNLVRLLHAFAAAGAVRAALVIAGDGPERGRLERETARLGLGDRVRFLGHVAHPETVVGALDVFAMSSDTEQMPIGLIEAMAAALPVAATDVGDVKAMLAPDNRPFVTPCDADALAASLGRLLGDATLRQRLGMANRRKARTEFAQERMTAAWDALWSL